jgi:hypothetical protein
MFGLGGESNLDFLVPRQPGGANISNGDAIM